MMLKVSSNKLKTIALDFDGVLHSYKTWDGDIPKNSPVDGALSFVNDLVDMGYEVVIFSSRAKNETGKKGISDWLEKHDFPKLKVHHDKPAAELYVDDRGYRFDGDFSEVRKFIKDGLEPWYK